MSAWETRRYVTELATSSRSSASLACVYLHHYLVIAFLLLIRYVALWPWPLTFWLWIIAICRGSRSQLRHQVWRSCAYPFLRWVMMSVIGHHWPCVCSHCTYTKLWPINRWLRTYLDFSAHVAYSQCGAAVTIKGHLQVRFSPLGGFWAFVKRFAPCYQTVFCLSVCDVGVLWPNCWMDQYETWHAGRPRPWPHCVRWGPSSSSPKAGGAPNFRPMSIVAKRLDGWRCHLVRK